MESERRSAKELKAVRPTFNYSAIESNIKFELLGPQVQQPTSDYSF